MDNNNKTTFDDLLIKTFSTVTPLPDKIDDLEDSINDLVTRFETHNVDPTSHNLRNEFEILQGNIRELNTSIAPLVLEYNNRRANQKEIKAYIKDGLTALIKYAMLPLLIVVAIGIGVPAEYLPWYKPQPKTPSIISEDNINILKMFIDTVSSKDGYIDMVNIEYIMKQYENNIIVIRDNSKYNINKILNDINNKFIVVLPVNGKGEKYIQYFYNKDAFGLKIRIKGN